MLFICFSSLGLLLYLYGGNITDYIRSSKEYSEIQKDNTTSGDIIIPDGISDDIVDIIKKEEYACINVDYQKLKEQNTDYIGWIYVPQTKISYPVVKSTDNNDYLHKSFKKRYSFSGTVFMDCRNNGNANSVHSVLYGHNMKNGTMFAGLKKFTSKKYLEKHPVFWFIDKNGNKMLFRIFSVEKPKATNPVTYNCFENFSDIDTWKDEIIKIKENSMVNLPVDVSEKNIVMSMSTCTGQNNIRCVVHGLLEAISYNDK